jgi:endonuclease YncB( thermonuclease family)
MRWLLPILVVAVATPAPGIERDDSDIVARPAATTWELVGTCESVVDGDTFVLATDQGTEWTVKLKYADAPELDQMFGLEAKQKLLELLDGTSVDIRVRTFRALSNPLFAVVTVEGTRVDELLVRNGLAWAVTRETEDYQLERSELDYLESEAREMGRGLWIYDSPCPPWTWRESLKKHETKSGSFAHRPTECGAVTPPVQQLDAPESSADLSRYRPGSSLEILIDENGDVDVETVYDADSTPESHRAIIDEVRQWKFSPALLRGEPVKYLKPVDVWIITDEDREPSQ